MLVFEVLIIAANIRTNSMQSFIIESYSISLRYSVLCKTFSQYFVSLHSFSAMLSLCVKSFLLSAYSASTMFAAILVPERFIWELISNSFF